MSFPKRTDTVENILQQPNVPYEEIFKTRLRVIDDRSPSQNTNYSEAKNTDRYLDQSANSHTNSNQASVRSSPVQKSTGRASPLVKADNLMHNKLSYKKVAWDSNRIKKVQNEQDNFKEIMTTSELLVLPELEIKYLEQYQLHTNYIMNISDKVDYLSKKVKEIKRFINDRVEEEQEALVPQIVKIQALFRGYLCRKKLIESGLPTFKRKRYYPNIAEVYHAAIKIQSLWRGYNIRKKHADQLQIDILKALVRKQGQQLKLQGDGNISKVSKDVNMLKMVVTSQQEEIAKFEKLNRSISQNNQELLSIFKEQQMEFYSLKEQFIKFREESLLEVTKLKQELESLKSQKSTMIRAPSSEQLEFLSGIEEGLSVTSYLPTPI
ncbi:hypothetical protein HDV04_005285 [Boothiomyces sp. JEL0838]|nr:hypothetical protein HDV04_005285 [Boothiomyces sp. JEL0838]